MKNFNLLLLFLIYSSFAAADAIDMRDFIIVKSDITEAELLYKFGAPDHETVNSDRYNYILSKTWFYIPEKNDSNKWVSEFRFNGNGRLISKDRYRAH